MSSIEHKKGKLILLPNNWKTLDEQIKEILINEWYELNLEIHGTSQEMFEDLFYNKYFINWNDIYKIETIDLDETSDIVIWNKIWDDIDFEVRWYNGWASFQDMLNQVIKKTK